MLFPVKKRSLTLIEIVIAIVLLSFLLTGLFNVFYQGLKKSIAAKEVKQNVVQLELFQQRIKTLFSQKKSVWLEKHPEVENALFVSYEQSLDPEFDMCGNLLGMLYLNSKKQLCLISWSETQMVRIETLLDKVDDVHFRLFEAKTGEWLENWPLKKKDSPVMVSIKLERGKKQIPFVFFLTDPDEHITYSGPT